MGRSAAENVLRNYFEEEIGYEWDDIKPTDDLRLDLNFDSLDLAKLEAGIESIAGVEVPKGWADTIRTVRELQTAVERLMEQEVLDGQPKP